MTRPELTACYYRLVEEQALKWWHVRWRAAGRLIYGLALVAALIVVASYLFLHIAVITIGYLEGPFLGLVLLFFAFALFAGRKVKSFRKTLVLSSVIAVVLYVTDSFVFHIQFFGEVVLLYFVVATIWALLNEDRRAAGLRATNLSIYFLAVVSIYVTNDLQDKMGDRRTVKLGDACLAYRAKYHHYPQNLNALVPEFISSVPVARFGLPSDRFVYAGGPFPDVEYLHVGPRLRYENPMRRWREYDVESHTWRENRRMGTYD